jgi:hypothetical protein
MDKTETREQIVELTLSRDEMAALDAWIARHPDPKPSRADGAREVLIGALGGRLRSTALPGIVTGRDIFD